MHARILEVVEPGMRKNDLVAEIFHAAITGVEGAGGDYPAIVPMAPTGIDASAAHLTWDDKPMRAGRGDLLRGSRASTGATTARSAARCSWAGPVRAERDAEGALVEAIEAGAGCRQAGEPLRGHPPRVHGLACAPRPDQGEPAAATPSGSAIRRTGASAPSACDRGTAPCLSPT